MSTRHRRLLASILIAAAACRAAGAQEVVAVLSSSPGPYQAAYESFAKDFGAPVPAYRLPRETPEIGPAARVVVAFGGEAAVQPYPKGTVVIACLAPGLPEPSGRGGPTVFVAMKPPAAALLGQIRKLQPRVKRLAVLWNSAYTERYLDELKSAAAAQGVEIDAVKVPEVDDLPNALRSLAPKPDALWLAPDPRLITPASFQTIKQFSWDNAIPFYAPTAGLAAAGASAAVSISSAELGRRLAELTRQALSGAPLPSVAYAEKTELTVNPASAAKAGLVLTPEALGQADKVLP